MTSPMPDLPADFVWPSPDEVTSELISGGTINELAQAANEHGIMITISFIPATEDAADVSD